MTDDATDLPPAARCGMGTIDGSCWRPGDPNKHLGPPYRLQIRYWSKLFATRCGLGPRYPNGDPMGWRKQEPGENDDVWCPACLDQAGIRYELWTDDTDYRDPLPWQVGGRNDEPGPGP